MKKKENTGDGNTNDAIKYSALGINFAVAPAVGFALGYFIDNWFGTGNLFKWILSMSGFLAAILEVVRAARKYARQSEQNSEKTPADRHGARTDNPSDAWSDNPSDAWNGSVARAEREARDARREGDD